MFDALEIKFDDLGRQMRVLHEDLVGRIANLAPDYTPIRREFKLQPLEAAVRLRRRK